MLLAKPSTPLFYYRNRWYTTTDVKKDVDIVCSQLSYYGVEPGQRVLIAYPNSYAFAVTYLAILLHGCVIVPVNPGMPAAEFAVSLLRSQVRCAFLTENQWTTLLSESDDSDTVTGDYLDTVLVSQDEQTVSDTAFVKSRDGWAQVSPQVSHDSLKLPTPPETTVGVLLYTSGTTGKPKAVGLQHRQLYAAASNVAMAHRLSSRDVAYCILPLFHINAQVVVLLASCITHGRIVLAPRFSATEFWSTIQKHGITWVSAVPTIITILANKKAPSSLPSSLRFVRSASAQLPVLYAERFERRFQIPVIQSYGMTEAGSQICVNPLTDGKRKLASVGLPVGVQLRIVDHQHRVLKPGEVGEIVIRGENVIEYYVEAASQKDFVNGWFHTGDLGYTDADGFVYLTGRKKEIINRAGEKISPYEVEDVIRQHPVVDQVAVIGLPDDLYGEQVAAYITLHPSTMSHQIIVEEIDALCKRVMSAYKCPTTITVVDEIPVGETGKIQRNRLKAHMLRSMAQ